MPKLNTNERKAFEESYERLNKMCTVIAMKITNDIGLAEDVVHSAFEKIMEHRDKYFSLPDSKRDAYIVVMVKNKAIDTMRGKKNTNVTIDDVNNSELECIAYADVEKIYEDKEGYEYLKTLIRELPQLYQVVFEMRYVEDFSIEEISQMLDIKKTTVTKQLERSRAKMKRKINVRVISIIIASILIFGAIMLNDNVRAATWGRLVSWWQNHFSLHFQGDDSDSSLRHNFWQPEYVPEDLHLIFSEFYNDYHMGAFSQVIYATNPALSTDNLHVMFSANWMHWFEDGTWGGGWLFPENEVDRTIINDGGIEYSLLVAQTDEGISALGGSPVLILWEHGGFMFQLQGNANSDTLVKIALSVEPFDGN